MSDLSTFAGQAAHYAAVRERLCAPRLLIPSGRPPIRRRYIRTKVEKKPEPPYGAPFNFFTFPSHKTIIKLVSLKHGVTVEDMLGPRRARHLVAARHEAMRLTKSHLPHLSLLAIGRIFNRDHTTVLWATGELKKKGQVKHLPGVATAILQNPQIAP